MPRLGQSPGSFDITQFIGCEPMSIESVFRQRIVWSLLSLSSAVTLLGVSSPALAQVSNADFPCYLSTAEGRQYDLSALCAGFENSQAVVLQSGDVQVTLRWDTADDLDLFVRDPFGEEVSYFEPEIASGGQLDVDANAGCSERMAEPVENIFWPTGGGVPGDYVVTVDLYSHCGPEAPVNFTLTTLVQGEVQTQTGTVSADQTTASFPFTFADSSAPTGAATP